MTIPDHPEKDIPETPVSHHDGTGEDRRLPAGWRVQQGGFPYAGVGAGTAAAAGLGVVLLAVRRKHHSS